jgi:hypothetical protein
LLEAEARELTAEEVLVDTELQPEPAEAVHLLNLRPQLHWRQITQSRLAVAVLE